jgi:hypothetical protein
MQNEKNNSRNNSNTAPIAEERTYKSSIVSQTALDYWIENNLNVLFEGEAGVGKTSIIVSAFKEHGLKFRTYSAATMDPFVDMIGVPREVLDADGKRYLELVRPREWENDEVEAIFIDEFNRAHKKIRNAVLELIQFKSINGRKFNNLRIVWAAINPENSEFHNEYDVETLDPAQKDRFHVFHKIPYMVDLEYFKSKYSNAIGEKAYEWWNGLGDKTKQIVSPRRLDYAVAELVKAGSNADPKWFLPGESNPAKLQKDLASVPIIDKLEYFMSERSKNKRDALRSEAKEWLADPNNLKGAETIMLTEQNKVRLLKYFLPIMPREHIARLIAGDGRILKIAEGLRATEPVIDEILQDQLKMNADLGGKTTKGSGNSELDKRIAEILSENDSLSPYKEQIEQALQNLDGAKNS